MAAMEARERMERLRSGAPAPTPPPTARPGVLLRLKRWLLGG